MLLLTNKAYDTAKYVVTIVLPAAGTLYFTLSQIWGWPYGEEIVGTLSAFTLFGGALLKISSDNYYKQQADEDISERG